MPFSMEGMVLVYCGFSVSDHSVRFLSSFGSSRRISLPADVESLVICFRGRFRLLGVSAVN
jgi:hypothetical protein